MTATLLPNAKAQFIDGNGKPLAGGTVYFYIPNTSTPKATYQDSAQTILNPQPIVLDANGQAIIWGNGTYRQVVYDQFGNLIWDQITEDTTGGLIGDFIDQTFVSGVDFTPGTTTQLTLSSNFGSVDNIWVFFDAAYQGDDQLSLLGTTLTFGSPIPVGVQKVYVKGGTTIAVGTPSDGTVTDSKVASGSALMNRLTHIYDPMDPKYGCKFDGVTDDAAGLNAVLQDAANSGGVILFPLTGTALIKSPLICTPTVQLAPALTGSALYMSDMRTVTLWSPGRCTIKAGATMTTMLNFTFNSALSDIGPYFTKVDGLVFDGNSMATNGTIANFVTKMQFTRCTYANMAGVGHINDGYGAAEYLYNTYITQIGIQVQRGGDLLIDHCDFYAPPNSNGHLGIDLQGFSGNSHIHSCVFTADATSTNETPVYMDGTIPSQAGEEVRDVTIEFCEISGYDLAITGVASTNNVYNCIIRDNHKTAFGTKISGAFLSLIGANGFIVDSNIIGNPAYPVLTGNPISLTNCSVMSIRGNKFVNLHDTPIVFSGVTESTIKDNDFINYGQGSAGNVAIFLGGVTTQVVMSGNTYNQGNAAFGQLGVAEHTGCDQNLAHDEHFVGVTQPYLVVGPNSVLQRKEYASAPGSITGFFNSGDLVLNPAPTAAKNITSWICISGGNPAGFSANGCGSGTTGARPALTSNDFGYLYRDTTVGHIVFWDGAAWQPA